MLFSHFSASLLLGEQVSAYKGELFHKISSSVTLVDRFQKKHWNFTETSI